MKLYINGTVIWRHIIYNILARQKAVAFSKFYLPFKYKISTSVNITGTVAIQLNALPVSSSQHFKAVFLHRWGWRRR